MTFDATKKFGEKHEAGCPVLKVQCGKFYNSALAETDSNGNVIVVKPVETEEEKIARLEKVAAEKKLAEELKLEKAANAVFGCPATECIVPYLLVLAECGVMLRHAQAVGEKAEQVLPGLSGYRCGRTRRRDRR